MLQSVGLQRVGHDWKAESQRQQQCPQRVEERDRRGIKFREGDNGIYETKGSDHKSRGQSDFT